MYTYCVHVYVLSNTGKLCDLQPQAVLVCPGHSAVLNCTVRDSVQLAWNVAGVQLTFRAIDNVGAIRNETNAVAILVKKETESGEEKATRSSTLIYTPEHNTRRLVSATCDNGGPFCSSNMTIVGECFVIS